MYFASRLFIYSREILSSVSVYLVVISCGIQNVWTSPASDKIFQTHTVSPWLTNVDDFPMTRTVTVFNIGAFVGPVITVLTFNSLGRKKTHLISIFTQILSALLYIFAANIEMIYIARFFDGMTFAMCTGLASFYLGEILSDNFRTVLIALTQPIFQIGALLQFGILPYTNVTTTAFIFLMVSSLALVFYFFMEESPYYLLLVNKEEEAKKSIAVLRKNVDTDKEFGKCKKMFTNVASEKLSLKSFFKNRAITFSLLVIIGLSVIDVLLGADLLVQYPYLIFSSIDNSLPIEEIAVVLTIVPMLATIIIAPLIHKFSRRWFFAISIFVNCICVTIFFTYYSLKIQNFNVHPWRYVPTVSVILLKTSSKVCLTSLIAAYSSELIPINAKSIAQMVCIFSVCLIKTSYNEATILTVENLGFIYLLGFITVFSFCCVFFVVFLPETDGISLHKIQESYDKK